MTGKATGRCAVGGLTVNNAYSFHGNLWPQDASEVRRPTTWKADPSWVEKLSDVRVFFNITFTTTPFSPAAGGGVVVDFEEQARTSHVRTCVSKVYSRATFPQWRGILVLVPLGSPRDSCWGMKEIDGLCWRDQCHCCCWTVECWIAFGFLLPSWPLGRPTNPLGYELVPV